MKLFSPLNKEATTVKSSKKSKSHSESEEDSDSSCSVHSKSDSESEEDSCTTHSETLSSNGEATHTHQVEHQISNSEESIDREIHKLVKKHTDMNIEEMSDFSIQSPVQRSKSSMKNSHLSKTVAKKIKFGSAKKGSDDNNKHSSESELEMTENSASKVPVGSQLKHGVREQHLSLRYKTPEGFEPSKLTVSKSDVCQEDLDGKELWLIRAPVDFDIKQLDGSDIDLKGHVDFRTIQNDYYEVIGTRDKRHQLRSFSTIFPSKEKSSFVVGPKFKGQIHVMQSLEIPPLPPIKELKPVVHNVPEDLKQRFEPFGSGSPRRYEKKHQHHKAGSLLKRKIKEEKDLTDEEQLVVKKKRKKHRKS